MGRTQAFEQVKAALDKLWNEGDVTGAELARARELLVALKPPEEPQGSSSVLESMREAKRQVESWKLWQRAAMGIPDQTEQRVEARERNFEVLPERCPKCNDYLIANSRGIECGSLRCDYTHPHPLSPSIPR